MKQILIAAIALLSLLTTEAQDSKKITLEDLFVHGTFRQKSVTGLRSMNDGEHYTTLANSSRIVKNSYKTGEALTILFDLYQLEDPPIKSFSNYTFSEDETKILLTTHVNSIYRRSYTAEYYIWDTFLEELYPLSEKGVQQAAVFSPDGERVAFVRDNNIFIKNLKFGTESQVTHDGKKNEIINGIPDWVYEEEFGFNNAMAWSPDSKFLAYLRFDESNVREFGLPLYGGEAPCLEENIPYPGTRMYKYPKAGENNSVVSTHVYEIRSRTTIKVDTGEESDIYLPRLRWTPDANDLHIMRLNRLQNQLDILYANPYTGETRIFYTEKNKRYISENFLDDFTYLPDGGFVVVSERDGWSHLYHYDRQGFELKQLTEGNFDVTGFYGYNPDEEMFYYQAATESPLHREVCFQSLDGKKQGKLSTLEGTTSVAFSKGFEYHIQYFSNAKTPVQVTLYGPKGKKIRVLEDNQQLQSRMKEYNVPVKEFFHFQNPEGTELNGWMLKPAGFDPSREYPVVVYQYSGPNSQSVTDHFQVGWYEYLAQQGFLVACVDPRGTGARGEDFRKVTYMQLGKYESEDLISTARYLAGLPFTEEENMAIFGWSYGGFMVSLTLCKTDLFKAGIAVAPVTDWRFYDTAYTERYMRTPGLNPDGYTQNAPLTLADKLTGNLLLIHGSADDNVHLQNTMEFSEKLVQAGIPFQMALYTNRDHGIRGGNTSLHLHQKMTNFLIDQLQ
jgi:dipeptidyl-peptidase 4